MTQHMQDTSHQNQNKRTMNEMAAVQELQHAYPPATYARLAALKRRYDPANLFHLNQNIVPVDL